MDESFNEASQVLHNEKLSASTVRFVNSKAENLQSGIYENYCSRMCCLIFNDGDWKKKTIDYIDRNNYLTPFTLTNEIRIKRYY